MAPKPCKVDAEQLIAYLRNPSSNPDLPQHMVQCRYCQVRLLAMAAAANSQGPGRVQHFRYLEALLRYLEDEASGQTDNANHLSLLQHLAVCEDCFSLYQELRAMDEWVMTYTDASLRSSQYRPPDLSFLQQAKQTAQPPARSHDADASPVTAVTWLLGTLRVGLALLFQPPTLAPSTVRSAQYATGTGDEMLEVKEISLGAEQVTGLDIDVRLYIDVQDRTRTRLDVYARAVDRPSVDFAGTAVAVRLADGQLISLLTDELGLATFEGLPEEALRTAVLEITPRPS